MSLINLLIFIPFFVGLILITGALDRVSLVIGDGRGRRQRQGRETAAGAAEERSSVRCKINFAACCAYLSSFIVLGLAIMFFCKIGDKSAYEDLHYETGWSIISAYKIKWSLKVDDTSIYFILLTALITPICLAEKPDHAAHSGIRFNGWLSRHSLVARRRRIMKSGEGQEQQHSLYSGLILILSSLVIGFFMVQDLLLFYILYELVLIPTFFIIGIWGGKEKVFAAVKFFIYTFAASIMALVAVIYLITQFENGDLGQIIAQRGAVNEQHAIWLWAALFLAFAVKIPMVPIHTWLPDAHVQAPTGGSIFLAAVLLKMGGYGMLRVLLPLFPDLSARLADFVMLLSCFAMIYASFVAFAQENMKKLIAYSSIAHMGYVTAALFAGKQLGEAAAVVQMISHGLISAGMFLLVGIISSQSGSKLLADYSGIAARSPQLAGFFVAFAMASIGLPGTSGFLGEFLAITAVFGYKTSYGVMLAAGLLLGAAYMLQLTGKIIFGKRNETALVKKLNAGQLLSLGVLLAAIIFIGLGGGQLIFVDLFKNRSSGANAAVLLFAE